MKKYLQILSSGDVLENMDIISMFNINFSQNDQYEIFHDLENIIKYDLHFKKINKKEL